MSWWPKLRPHQLDLLRRIADGSQPVTARESALARTVYALRTRKLVTTPRADGVWTAVITDAGRYYLEHGEYVGAGTPRSSPARRNGRCEVPILRISTSASGSCWRAR